MYQGKGQNGLLFGRTSDQVLSCTFNPKALIWKFLCYNWKTPSDDPGRQMDLLDFGKNHTEISLKQTLMWLSLDQFEGCRCCTTYIQKWIALLGKIQGRWMCYIPPLFTFCLMQLICREVFEKNFPDQSHFMPYFWMPRWTDVRDPSARFISHYAADKQ